MKTNNRYFPSITASEVARRFTIPTATDDELASASASARALDPTWASASDFGSDWNLDKKEIEDYFVREVLNANVH